MSILLVRGLQMKEAGGKKLDIFRILLPFGVNDLRLIDGEALSIPPHVYILIQFLGTRSEVSCLGL